MKHRECIWSLKGAYTMSRLIILDRINLVDDLFFGNWRKEYEYCQNQRFKRWLSPKRRNKRYLNSKIFQRVGNLLLLTAKNLSIKNFKIFWILRLF